MNIADKKNIGQDMLACASRQWFQYDDNDAFSWEFDENDFYNATRTVVDPDEGKRLEITPLEFFDAHHRLIYNNEMADVEKGAHISWYEWATKSHGVDMDDYDDYTCDFVLQVLLYGEIIYS